jgi:membrane associated rhomboid family serine protease
VLFPVRDHNPRQSFPVVTLLIVAANVLVFLFERTLRPTEQALLVQTAGAIPFEIAHHLDIGAPNLLPLPGSLWTSMFLHGSWLHLIGNMWFLWLFGDNVEDAMGPLRYAAFYFFTGSVGAMAQILAMPDSLVPMIGASGAVAGALGGYVLLYPRASIVTFPFFWEVPAWVFLGLWFVGQFFLPTGSGVAWMAHVGGFLAGLGAVRLLARRPRALPVEVEYLPPRR